MTTLFFYFTRYKSKLIAGYLQDLYSNKMIFSYFLFLLGRHPTVPIAIGRRERGLGKEQVRKYSLFLYSSLVKHSSEFIKDIFLSTFRGDKVR